MRDYTRRNIIAIPGGIGADANGFVRIALARNYAGANQHHANRKYPRDIPRHQNCPSPEFASAGCDNYRDSVIRHAYGTGVDRCLPPVGEFIDPVRNVKVEHLVCDPTPLFQIGAITQTLHECLGKSAIAPLDTFKRILFSGGGRNNDQSIFRAGQLV